MPNYQKRIVYLSDAQRQELFTNGTITVNGQTITYDANDMYVTPQEEPYIKPTNGIPASDLDPNALSSKADKNNTVITTSLSMYRKANTTVGGASTAIGGYNTASGNYSTAFGNTTTASGTSSFVSGTNTEASGMNSVAEGNYANADGRAAHAAGEYTRANGRANFVRGRANILNTTSIFPEWAADTEYTQYDRVKVTTESNGETTVTLYMCTTSHTSTSTFDSSKWEDVTDYKDFADIVGNGRNGTDRSNAYALDWNGNAYFKGNVYTGCDDDSTGGSVLPRDVQVNGISVVQNGVANVPVMSTTAFGVAKIGTPTATGIRVNSNGVIYVYPSTPDVVKAGTSDIRPIVPNVQDASTFYGLAKAAGDTTMASSSNAVGTYTTEAKSAIQSMLGIDLQSIASEVEIPLVETVTGLTPSITGQPNTRYNCGEVSTISITPPSAGSIDVIFESGSIAAVLTVPNTVKFPAWFDATALEANTIYEILITDGIYGSVMTWAN